MSFFPSPLWGLNWGKAPKKFSTKILRELVKLSQVLPSLGGEVRSKLNVWRHISQFSITCPIFHHFKSTEITSLEVHHDIYMWLIAHTFHTLARQETRHRRETGWTWSKSSEVKGFETLKLPVFDDFRLLSQRVVKVVEDASIELWETASNSHIYTHKTQDLTSFAAMYSAAP